MKTTPFCGDCPDREACHQGASCEYVRGVEAFFRKYDENLKGKTKMTAAKKTTVTANDVVDQAVEEKLVVVPAQSEGEKSVSEIDQEDNTSDDVEDGKDKVSLRNRLAGLLSKVRENKKVLGAAAVVAGVSVYALAKAAAKKAAQEIEDETKVDSEGFDNVQDPTLLRIDVNADVPAV